MGECEYYMDLGALGFKGEAKRTFYSDRELDEFLWEWRGQLLAANSKDVAFYDLNPQDNQIELLKIASNIGEKFAKLTQAAPINSLPQKMDELVNAGDPNSVGDLAIGIGFSRLYELAGDPDVMKRPVKTKKIESEENRELSEKRRTLAINTGLDGHAILEAKINKTKAGSLKVLSKTKILKDHSEQAIDLAIATIKDRHTVNGVPPQMRAEIPLVPKTVNPVWLNHLRTLRTHTTNNVGDISQARPWGRTDLVVIDNDGKVWIYDFKFTQNPIITGTKDNAANEMNLASYGAVARQYDLNVSGLAFVNFKTTHTVDGTEIIDVSFDPETGILPITGGKIIDAANSYYPWTNKTAVKTIDDVQTTMDRAIPQNTIMNQRQAIQLDVEEEFKQKKPVAANPAIQSKHPKVKYIYFVPTTSMPSDINPTWFYGNWLLAESEEQMKERLDEYIEKRNAMPTDILLTVANAVENAIAHKSTEELAKAMKEIRRSNAEQLTYQFSKYVHNGWMLNHDETMLQNGYFLFQKPGTNIAELVMVDTHRLDSSVHFNTKNDGSNYADPRRTTILGEFLHDSDVDPMFFMRGFVGNAVLMKGMAWLSEHDEELKGLKIRSIKAMSVVNEKVYEASNFELTGTWDRLVFEYNKRYKDNQIKSVKQGLLMDDVDRAVDEALDIITTSSNEDCQALVNYSAFRELHPASEYTIQELIRMYKAVASRRTNWDSSKMSKENDLDMARVALLRGAAAYYDVQTKPERDIGQFTTRGTGNMALEGTDAASMKESQSVILRQQSTVITNFHDVYKAEFVKLATKFQIAYKAFRKAVNLSPILGDDFKYFRDNWFIKDGDKVDNSLSIKRFEDPYWQTCSKEELAIRDLYFEYWNRLRYNNNSEKIEDAKEDGSYYEIPLITANFREQMSNAGMWDSIKGWAVKFKERSIGHLFDLDEAFYEEESEKSIETLKLPSYIQDMYRKDSEGKTVREKSIAKNGVGRYEMNMEIVTLTMLAVGLRRERSEHANMINIAIRALGYFNSIVNGHDMHNILNANEKITQSKMYSRSVIDPHNRGIAAVINFAKGFTSIGTIALKWESFARETIKGILDGFARTKFDEMYGGKFSSSDYMWALKEVATSAGQNADVTSFYMQLSHLFGMANFTGQQIVEASKSNPYSLYQIGQDALFITATWPDFIHRTAFLLAHLKHIGAIDAFYLGEDGVITYDMTKDQRFQTYLKYKGKESEIPEKEIPKWREEFELYKQMLKDFENAGEFKDPIEHAPYEIGDTLPNGLSPRQQDNLKTVADRLYGNYDKETKSLMQEQLLGALFFQFKTFPLERLSWWFKSPTHINDIEMKQQYWDDGEKVIQYIGDDQRFYFGKYEDIDPKWLVDGRAWYYKCPNGHEVFGHINRIFCAASYVLNHNVDEYKHTWETNPYFRGQMALALYDTLFGVLLAFLIQALMGEETTTTMKDQEWYARWLYTVGTGMMQDGPVWGLIDGIVGDGAPPSLSILRNYLTSATSVITGDTNFIYAFASSLGATKNFTSLLTEQ